MNVIQRGHEGSGAIFSPEAWPIYRYVLWRHWREGHRGRVLFVMLNPSTADESVDDATIRRCRHYAKDWGWDGVAICNLYGLRSTDPRALRQAADPIGPENETILRGWAESASMIVCAWGVHGTERGKLVARQLVEWSRRPIYALAWTQDGTPRHPFYLPGALKPLEWNPSC